MDRKKKILPPPLIGGMAATTTTTNRRRHLTPFFEGGGEGGGGADLIFLVASRPHPSQSKEENQAETAESGVSFPSPLLLLPTLYLTYSSFLARKRGKRRLKRSNLFCCLFLSSRGSKKKMKRKAIYHSTRTVLPGIRSVGLKYSRSPP